MVLPGRAGVGVDSAGSEVGGDGGKERIETAELADSLMAV